MFIGITGALVSAHKDPTLTAPFGIAMIATGIVCYSVSFLRIDRREGNRQNFAFFSTAALASTLTGSALMLDGMAELGLFVLASLTLAWFGARRRRATLSLHAAIYVLAAGFASGLIPKAFDALVGSGRGSSAGPGPRADGPGDRGRGDLPGRAGRARRQDLGSRLPTAQGPVSAVPADRDRWPPRPVRHCSLCTAPRSWSSTTAWSRRFGRGRWH